MTDENSSHGNSNMQDYRIVFFGVAAELATNTLEGLRTGQYLSCGEIFSGASCCTRSCVAVHFRLDGWLRVGC
jgi:hypothetical protein